MGIEPTSSAWEAEVLPLNYARLVWSSRIRPVTQVLRCLLVTELVVARKCQPSIGIKVRPAGRPQWICAALGVGFSRREAGTSGVRSKGGGVVPGLGAPRWAARRRVMLSRVRIEIGVPW